MISNQDIVARARELAAGADGLRRRSALCVAVACRESSNIAGAEKLLGQVEQRDVKAAAFELLGTLASEGSQT